MSDESTLGLDTSPDAVGEETDFDADLEAAHERGDLGADEGAPAEADEPDRPDDGAEVDWADVWATAGLVGGAGTMSMTQLTLALDVVGATGSLDRDRAATLVAEAVEARLLADVGSVDGTKFALTGGRR